MYGRPCASAALILSIVGVACGSPPAVVVTPPILEAPKPPPTRAHWSFPIGQRKATAQLDLGVGTRLYAGVQGLRRVARNEEPPTEALTIALDDYLGVLKDDAGRFLFVVENGDVLAASDPLGPLGERRPGPLKKRQEGCATDDCTPEAFAWMATGKRAILGITRDRRVLRSADFGATWTEVAATAGRPASIELDTAGNGLLLRYPQALYLTHDDGATWTSLASPGIGANEIRRDADDRVWLMGIHDVARLDGSVLNTSRERPSEVKTQYDEPRDGRSDVRRTLLCGERRIELSERVSDDARSIQISSVGLGDNAPKVSVHAKLAGESFSSLVGCDGADMLYLRPNEEQENTPRTSTMFRSHDWGGTWTEEGTTFGTSTREPNDADVTMGPDGWTYIGELCPAASPEDGECNHRKIRPAKAAAFEDMAFTEEFVPQSFAFDRDHDRVYALGNRNGSLYLYESPLTQNHFSRVKLVYAGAQPHAAITVDGAGTVRVVVRDDNRQVWTLDKRPFGGEAQPTLVLSIGDGVVAMAGQRGVLFTLDGRGWETADGGDSWRATSALATAGIHCSSDGCIGDEGATRIGWDAPVVTDGEVVSASTEPTTTFTGTPTSAPPNEARVDLVCKPAGSSTPVPTTPNNEYVDGRGEVRWATPHRSPDQRVWVTYGSRTGVRDVELFAPVVQPKAAPGSKVIVTYATSDVRRSPDGLVAARYRLTVDKGVRQAVDVDLAWWSTITGKPHRHELKKIPVFSVSPSNGAFSGNAQVVEGGVVFQPSYGREGYFVRDDGKVESLPAMAGLALQNVEHVGKTWIALQAATASPAVWWWGAGAVPWTRKDWSLESRGSVSLAAFAGHATVAFARAGAIDSLFRIPDVPSPDPAAPVLVKHGEIPFAGCPAGAVFREASTLPQPRRRVHLRVEGAKKGDAALGQLSSTARVTRILEDGSLCVSAEVVTGNDPKTNDAQTAFVYAEPAAGKGALFTGYWFHRTPDPKDKARKITVASQLTCERAPSEGKR